MAKQGVHLAQLTHLLQERARAPGWALCIGAGTSLPAFPSWDDLATRLMTRDSPSGWTADVGADLLTKYSPDALIQATQDRLGLDDPTFAGVLAEELYHRLKADLSKGELALMGKCLTARGPDDLKKRMWQQFLDLLSHHYAGLGALQLAEVVADVVHSERAPTAILSFNAEPLFSALLNAVIATTPDVDGYARPRGVFIDRVTHSTSLRRTDRTPVIFCHGLLPIPGRRNRPWEVSTDKLVFSEASYLALANTNFSWQAASFIDTCLTRSVVFVGVSLSDSNMRRWLSWIHANRLSELASLHAHHGASTTHLWLQAEPSTASKKRWLESLVAHLGVRVVWLPDWSHTGSALRTLLGI